MTDEAVLRALQVQYPDLNFSILGPSALSVFSANKPPSDMQLLTILHSARQAARQQLAGAREGHERLSIEQHVAALDEMDAVIRRESHEKFRRDDRRSSAIYFGAWLVCFAALGPFLFKQNGLFGLVIAAMMAVVAPVVLIWLTAQAVFMVHSLVVGGPSRWWLR